MLQRKFDQVADPAGRDLAGTVRKRQGHDAVAFAAALLCADRRDLA